MRTNSVDPGVLPIRVAAPLDRLMSPRPSSALPRLGTRAVSSLRTRWLASRS